MYLKNYWYKLMNRLGKDNLIIMGDWKANVGGGRKTGLLAVGKRNEKGHLLPDGIS